jgi:hypothetical protein
MSAITGTLSSFRRTWLDRTSELNASTDTVCTLLGDIDAWPIWTPRLKAVQRERSEALRVGTRFVMVIDAGVLPLRFDCTMFVLERDYIEWGVSALGSHVKHRFEVASSGAARCRVRHVEYATGLLAAVTFPFEKLGHAFDLAWSEALEAKYASGLHSA